MQPTVADLLAQALRQLNAPGDATASGTTSQLDAEVLLAHVLQVARSRLKSHPEQRVDAAQAMGYQALLARRAAGEPLAYLTGSKEFWSLPLAVDPRVLVPRPETELLVERALVLCEAREARIADLGTGSGALALAIASERPRWQLTATDVSAAALAVAAANATRLGLTNVTFRLGSWFEPLAGARFELLLSNPPYIGLDDPAFAGGALAHEPALALSPGADALGCLRLLAQGAPRHLTQGGWLLLEHGAAQGGAVRDALVLAGFAHVRSHRDLAGHERMTEGQHHGHI